MSTPHTEHHTEHPTDHALTLAIAGMTSASCAGRVEQALAKVAGVRQARVNLAGEIAIVSGDPVGTLRFASDAAGLATVVFCQHGSIRLGWTVLPVGLEGLAVRQH